MRERQIIKKVICFYVALGLFVHPLAAMAQGVVGYGNAPGAYGQAMGNRRQFNRMIGPNSPQGSFGADMPQQMPYEEGQPSMGNYPTTMGGMPGTSYQVHLLGVVGTPGTFRFQPSTRLDEALNVAGGVGVQGSSRRVEVRREGKRYTYDLFRFRRFGDISQNPFLLDNDVVYVPYAQRNVEIQGPIRNNGVYELTRRDTSVWDLIQLAGGFTVGAAQDQPVVIIRYIAGEKQLVKIDNAAESLAQESLRNGDIVIVPHILTKDRHFDYNVPQLPADRVFYPSFNDNVFVLGAVSLPGAYPFSTNYTVSDYVSMAGPARVAKFRSIRVVTANGKRIRNPSQKGFQLSPGDTIILPERHWTTGNVISWYNTIANSIITGFTLRELIRR